MRSFLIVGAAAFVTAAPAPQAFDTSALNALPAPPVQGPPVGSGPAQASNYNQKEAQGVAAAAASSGAKAKQVKRTWWNFPHGQDNYNAKPATAPAAVPAPPTVYGTVDAFKNNSVYRDCATSAKTPSSYQQAFVNYNGAVEGNGYLAFKELASYDVNACSSFCDGTSTCTGFNIFIERDPKASGSSDAVAKFKCSLFGQDIKKSCATNAGTSLNGFEVVIVASNGYNKKSYTPPTPPGCSKPQSCGTKLLNKPQYNIGVKTFPGPFDPSLCAAYAQSQNAANKKTSSWWSFGAGQGACVQFQAAYIEKEGKGFGTHCRLFSHKFQPSDSTFDISYGFGGSAGGSIGGSAGGSIGGSAGGSIGGSTSGSIGGSAGGSVGGSVGGSTGGSIGGSAGGSIGGSASGSVGGSTGGSIGGKAGGSIGGSAGGSIGGSTGGSVGGYAGGSAGGSIGGSAGGSVGGSAGGSVGGSASGSIGGSAGGSIGGSAGGSVGGSASGSVGGSASGSVGGSAGGSVGGSIGGSAGGSIGGSAGGSVGGSAGGSIGGSAGGSIGGSAGGSVGGSAGGSAGGSIGGSTGGSIGGSAGGSVGGSIGGSAGGSWGCQKSYTYEVDVNASFNWRGWTF